VSSDGGWVFFAGRDTHDPAHPSDYTAGIDRCAFPFRAHFEFEEPIE